MLTSDHISAIGTSASRQNAGMQPLSFVGKENVLEVDVMRENTGASSRTGKASGCGNGPSSAASDSSTDSS